MTHRAGSSPRSPAISSGVWILTQESNTEQSSQPTSWAGLTWNSTGTKDRCPWEKPSQILRAVLSGPLRQGWQSPFCPPGLRFPWGEGAGMASIPSKL